MNRMLQNPILPGFYPDPSICRAGEDYYLITSTFEYFPGLPIFHSRDLTNWHQIGHVLDRPSQLDLDGIRPSGGLFAPTIRYHQGVFYVINTLVDGNQPYSTFIVTAENPAGPWSEPHWLKESKGFDPSLFFDDDGRIWFTENRPAFEGFYEGHSEIYLQELDIETLQLIGEPFFLWDGALKGGIWAESSHIYKKDGFYYLMSAEGGTAHHHSVMIARSESIVGPYYGNPGNPILTHRHLGLDFPIVGTGHADLVETQNGEWWMALLAMRPYGGYFYNLGRETFLAPVQWEDGWPVVCPGIGRVEMSFPAPDLPETIYPILPKTDHFDNPQLSFQWNFIRTPRETWYSLTERPGFLRIKLRPQRLSKNENPSFIGRRQQHIHFSAKTVMEFTPKSQHETCGMALIQNPDFYFLFILTKQDDQIVLQLIRRAHGQESILTEKIVTDGQIFLKVEAHEQQYSFFYATNPDQWIPFVANADGRILSTPVAGGFVGTYIGLYGSSNGEQSSNHADFDWFEYSELAQQES